MIINDVNIFLGSCLNNFNSTYGVVGGLFIMGLVGGFSHCITMCGPFVVTQSDKLTKISDLTLLPYHAGRIVTYVILALVMYSMVNVVSFFTPMRLFIVVPLLLFAGLLFLINGFPKLQAIFPWVSKVTLPIPQRWISKLFSNATNRFFIGLVLGSMPCGMVVGAMMVAATASSYVMAGMAMTAFGIGTMPALIATAFGGQKLKEKFPNKMPVIRSGVMVWSGLWLFVMAGVMVMRG